MYVQSVLTVSPLRMSQLLAYLGLIIEANGKFLPDAWLEYDRKFRQVVARHPTKPWSIIDVHIWQLATTGEARSVCVLWDEPPSSTEQSLPFRPSRVPASGYSGANSPPGAAYFQGRPVCCDYNAGRCFGPLRQKPRLHPGPGSPLRIQVWQG